MPTCWHMSPRVELCPLVQATDGAMGYSYADMLALVSQMCTPIVYADVLLSVSRCAVVDTAVWSPTVCWATEQ